MKIKLPDAKDWNGAENCAINLRSVRAAGVKMCEPVGMPVVLLKEAGNATYILNDDEVLSVGDDWHDLYLNGKPVGSLSDAFINVLPGGRAGEATVFTAGGTQWISEGKLQPVLADSGVKVIVERGVDSSTLRSDVMFPDLRGNYPRLSELLDSDDSERVTRAFNDSFNLLLAQAEQARMFSLPVRLAWRMVDAEGQTVWEGEPQVVGASPEFDTKVFRLIQADGVLSLAAAATLELKTWPVKVEVTQSTSVFWRQRVAALEVLAWPATGRIVKRGYVLSRDSGVISLHANVGLELDDPGSLSPRVIARIANPLDGVKMIVGSDFGSSEASAYEPMATLKPSVVYRGGSLLAYSEVSRPGTLLLASCDNPLLIKGEHKVCGGKIVHICAPAGGGGGWNYGRLHLLVFATDGIYSVSVDSKLRSATSTCVTYYGVLRGDAVAVTPEEVYVANEIGQLLRIVGSRCRMVPFPSEVTRLAWNGDRAELWAINDMGAAFVMDADGGVALRSNIYVDRVVGQRLVVDQFGALRTLRVEEPQEVDVSWTCRCEDRFRNRMRTAVWKIDAANASELTLRLWADNGGASQRLVELRVDGAINAPVTARVICPTRAYFTAQIHGRLTPPARLNTIELT